MEALRRPGKNDLPREDLTRQRAIPLTGSRALLLSSAYD